MPSLDQSVTRHLSLVISKILTPLAISVAIACSFRFFKQLINGVIPTKWCGWFKKVSKWKHPFSHAKGIWYLIEQVKPVFLQIILTNGLDFDRCFNHLFDSQS